MSSRWSLQRLEPRCLLAVQPLPAIPALPAVLSNRIDADLWAAAHSASIGLEHEMLTLGRPRADRQDRIQVYIQSTGRPGEIVKPLQSLNVAVDLVVDEMKIVQAHVPAGALARVGRLAGVQSIRMPDYAFNNVVTSAGDSLLEADAVRQQFADYGIDGTGIKIGVISDGVTNRDAVGTELSFITVNPALPGNGNEGTAMLEIVHDLAPGAQLYFSGPSTSGEMVSSINYLVAQGCDVIIDDLIFFGESYFSDSAVATAAANAINSGSVYVTSAGNFGNQQHYQAQYLGGATSGSSQYHRFSTSPNDDFNDVTIPAGATMYVFLQWSDAWGTSGNNYDLFLTRTNGVALASSQTNQNGNDLPYEALGFVNNQANSRQVQIRILRRSGAAARELEFFTYFTASGSSMQYSVQEDALVGQEAAEGVMALAAVDAMNFPVIEPYSSRGGSTIYTNFATQTKIIRNSLDGAATDNVQTAIGQSGLWPFNPFRGTSAASPHAGAIAALILQAKPSLTPAQVAQVMADTALDLGAPGYDTTHGAGVYNALDAVYKVLVPAAPDLDSDSDLGISDSDNFTSLTLPLFTGVAPAGSFVRLLVDGLTSNTIQLGPAETSYSIAPGASLSNGTYSITVRMASSSSVAFSNNSDLSDALSVTVESIAPSVVSRQFNYDGVSQQSIAYAFSESIVWPGSWEGLVLMNLTTGLPVPIGDMVFSNPSDVELVITFPNFLYGALPDGIYQLAISSSALMDLAGNALAPEPALGFFYLAGDFNRDGRVDRDDWGILIRNWQGSSLTFAQGDSTYDGLADIRDLTLLSQNWNDDLFTI